MSVSVWSLYCTVPYSLVVGTVFNSLTGLLSPPYPSLSSPPFPPAPSPLLTHPHGPSHLPTEHRSTTSRTLLSSPLHYAHNHHQSPTHTNHHSQSFNLTAPQINSTSTNNHLINTSINQTAGQINLHLPNISHNHSNIQFSIVNSYHIRPPTFLPLPTPPSRGVNHFSPPFPTMHWSPPPSLSAPYNCSCVSCYAMSVFHEFPLPPLTPPAPAAAAAKYHPRSYSQPGEGKFCTHTHNCTAVEPLIIKGQSE